MRVRRTQSRRAPRSEPGTERACSNARARALHVGVASSPAQVTDRTRQRPEAEAEGPADLGFALQDGRIGSREDSVSETVLGPPGFVDIEF